MTQVVDSYRFVAPGGGGWSPADVTTEAWYDASDLASFTFSGGSVVSDWADLSGNGRTLSGGNQPDRSGSQNGLATVVFDATNDALQAASAADWKFLHDGTTALVGLVWRTVSSNPGNLSHVISTANIDAGNTGFSFTHDDRVSDARDDRLLVYVVNGGGVCVDGVLGSDDAFPAATFGVSTILVDANVSPSSNRCFVYTNGSLVSSAESSSTTPSSGNPTRALRLAGPGTIGTYTSLEFAELVFISGADATDAVRGDLEDYLTDKWGI